MLRDNKAFSGFSVDDTATAPAFAWFTDPAGNILAVMADPA
jgi:hypothetical protein